MHFVNLLKKVVLENKEKTALVDMEGSRKTTYDSLDELSSKVAGKLHSIGCKKGDFVAILMDRRMEYIAAYIGVLKAGCVVVPLVLQIPEERINYITKNCDAKIIIELNFFEDIANYEVFEDLAKDDEPALLIYTSGSTGTPKGILHTASGVTNSLNRRQPFEGLEKIELAATVTFSFIVNIQEIFMPLLYAGVVHIISEKQRRFPQTLCEYYEKHNINCGFVSSQMFQYIKNLPSSVKRIFTGGETLFINSLSSFCDVYYFYGQGETCGGVALNIINSKHSSITLGKPMSGIEIYICDENGNYLSDGEKGEICVVGNFGGSYYKDLEHTRKTFVPKADGKTLIHTGDIGFIDENGCLNYVNRKDWIIKINGQRVDLLEVEKNLLDIPHIKEAVVKSFNAKDLQTYMVGYYVSDVEISHDIIREILNKKLPLYMIPRYFVRLENFTKDVNGKIDRKILKEPIL